MLPALVPQAQVNEVKHLHIVKETLRYAQSDMTEKQKLKTES